MSGEQEVRVFTPEEVQQADGQEGRPAYIVHKGKVLDVSNSKLWPKGAHMRRHKSGKDLTEDMQQAPHGPEVLDRVPVLGVLKGARTEESGGEEDGPEFPWLLQKYPFLRRHPHPMTVHFPIVFSFAAPMFLLIYLIFGVQACESTAWHLLVADCLFIPVAIVTGILTWRVNYMGQLTWPVKVKLVLSVALFLLAVIAAGWRVAQGEPVNMTGGGLAYVLMVLAMAPITGLIGWYGASLTFPIEDE